MFTWVIVLLIIMIKVWFECWIGDIQSISSSPSECHWIFGYGSNMDRTHVEIKKNLTLFGK